MNTNILSFNICKLDAIWLTHKQMHTNTSSKLVKTIKYRSQWYKNSACKVFSCVKVFWKLKSNSRVEKIFANLLSTTSLKKIIPFFSNSYIKKNSID